jgi:hypothetical protein
MAARKRGAQSSGMIALRLHAVFSQKFVYVHFVSLQNKTGVPAAGFDKFT